MVKGRGMEGTSGRQAGVEGELSREDAGSSGLAGCKVSVNSFV